jgi:hypothetical protein
VPTAAKRIPAGFEHRRSPRTARNFDT